MKKAFLMSMILLMSGSFVRADDYGYLIVQRNDESATKTATEVSILQKISFEGANMVLTTTDGAKTLYELAGLDEMYFSTISGIKSANSEIQTEVKIYGADGVLIKDFTGGETDVQTSISTLPKGVYIVKAKGFTKKMIKR